MFLPTNDGNSARGTLTGRVHPRKRMSAPVSIVPPLKHRRYRQCYERMARVTWHGDLSVCANNQRTAPHFSQPAGLLNWPEDIIGAIGTGPGYRLLL